MGAPGLLYAVPSQKGVSAVAEDIGIVIKATIKSTVIILVTVIVFMFSLNQHIKFEFI